MIPWLIPLALVAALLLAGCGGSSAESETGTSAAVTGEQVCNLVSAAEVGKALDVEITDATASNDGTPGCVFMFDDGEEITGVVLAVMRPEDVEGHEAKEAFDYVLGLNRVFGAGASEEKVSGVGDQAVFMAGKNNSILIVQDRKQIITLAGPALTKDASAAIGKKAAASLK